MTFPFYQGNIQDLLRVAGQGQGSMFLGQMARAQREQQAADLKKTYLANLESEQKMKQSADQHPFNMDILKAKIKEFEDKSKESTETVRARKIENEVKEKVGVPTLARGVTTGIDKQEVDLSGERMKQWNDTFLSTEWSPSLFRNLPDLMTKYQLPTEIATQVASAAQNKQAWDQLRQQVYNSMRESRKQAQTIQGQKEIAETRGDAQIEAARLRTEAAAQRSEQVRNLQHAATQLNMKAWQLREQAKAAPSPQKEQMLQQAMELEARAAAYVTQAREMNPAMANQPIEFPGMPPRREPPPVAPVSPGQQPPPANAQPNAPAQIKEGTRIINPQTGQRMIRQNGQWVEVK